MASSSLWRATLTLLAGGAVAQALPLLLGPWLARLYTPEQFGAFTAFWVVASNLAVVACLRYEFALPLERDSGHATAVLALCLRVLAVSVLISALLAALLAAGGAGWPVGWTGGDSAAVSAGVSAGTSAGTSAGISASSPAADTRWPHAAWLPLAVAALGACQLFTMWATRAERFEALAVGRVVQHGGGALGQLGMGLAAGAAAAPTLGLIAAPIAAAAAAAAWLARSTGAGWTAALRRQPTGALRAAARRQRAFPLFNAPHAFAGALQDTVAVGLLAAWAGDAAVGYWGLALRYLKAPATLVGGAVSQALYPKLVAATPDQARRTVRQVMGLLAAVALPLAGLLMWLGPALFGAVFGPRWREAGELARALAPYIALHFIASPLAVVTMAWRAQAWALRLALVGQLMFVAALGLGLHLGGLIAAAWSVSLAMTIYFGWYFWKLATWPDVPPEVSDAQPI